MRVSIFLADSAAWHANEGTVDAKRLGITAIPAKRELGRRSKARMALIVAIQCEPQDAGKHHMEISTRNTDGAYVRSPTDVIAMAKDWEAPPIAHSVVLPPMGFEANLAVGEYVIEARVDGQWMASWPLDVILDPPEPPTEKHTRPDSGPPSKK